METLNFVRAVRDIDSLAKGGSLDEAIAAVDALAADTTLTTGQQDILAKKRTLLTSQSMRRAAVSGASPAAPFPPLTLVPRSVAIPAVQPPAVVTLAPPPPPEAVRIAPVEVTRVDILRPSDETRIAVPAPIKNETLLSVGEPEEPPEPVRAPEPAAPPVAFVPQPAAPEPPPPPPVPAAPVPPAAPPPLPAAEPAAAPAPRSDPAVDALIELASERIRVDHAPPMTDAEIEDRHGQHRVKLFVVAALLVLAGFAAVIGGYAIYTGLSPKDPPPVSLTAESPGVGGIVIGMSTENAARAASDAFGSAQSGMGDGLLSFDDYQITILSSSGRVSRITIGLRTLAKDPSLPTPDWFIQLDAKPPLRMSTPLADFEQRLTTWTTVPGDEAKNQKRVYQRAAAGSITEITFGPVGNATTPATWRPVEIEIRAVAPHDGK